MANLPGQMKALLTRNLGLLFDNDVALSTPGETTVIVLDGVPKEEQTYEESWSGKGSIQYVRPRIQKSFADLTGGTMEDPIAAVAYLPYEAHPTMGMLIVDIDGVLGPEGSMYVQSREPANVGGADVYWECYIGRQVSQ